jgi:uncharacterized protein
MKTLLFYPKIDCSVGCDYCFSDKLDKRIPYNKEKMIESAHAYARKMDIEHQQYSDRRKKIVLHGGEIFSIPDDDLNYFIEEVHKMFGEISIQTSLSELTDFHLDLVKKYKIRLGVSIDGPPELNVLRGPRSLEKNKIYQDNLIRNMNILKQEKLKFGCISVLTKLNSTGENIDKMENWILENEISGRFNPMFLPNWNRNSHLKDLELTSDEVKTFWLRMIELNKKEPQLDLNPIKEFAGNLLGIHLAPCVVCRCDYISTFCDMITPDGEMSRCDRCLQDGLYYVDSQIQNNNYRSEILKNTECKGCRYFEICGGGCPGEGVDGDFRRKTKFCSAYYGVYKQLEDNLRVVPNITLTIDIPDYFEKHHRTGRPFYWANRIKPYNHGGH